MACKRKAGRGLVALEQTFCPLWISVVETAEQARVTVVPVDFDRHIEHQSLLVDCQPVCFTESIVMRILHELPTFYTYSLLQESLL